MNNTGSITGVIRNDDGAYSGDLIHYFRVVFYNARNLSNPYHNFRHLFHVLWLCFSAAQFYATSLSKHDIRELLIAAMFHDFDYTGMMGNDDVNITLALRGLKKHLLVEDGDSYPNIEKLIRATQYPYVIPVEELDLRGKIIRDADLSQALSPAWIQQVIFGLSEEWNKAPIEVLLAQVGFLNSVKFHTEWAHHEFDLEAKRNEVADLIKLLQPQV